MNQYGTGKTGNQFTDENGNKFASVNQRYSKKKSESFDYNNNRLSNVSNQTTGQVNTHYNVNSSIQNQQVKRASIKETMHPTH